MADNASTPEAERAPRGSVASRLAGATGLERAIAGVVEETIVRTVESDAVVGAIERILTDGRLQEAIERSIDDEEIERAIRRALDSAVADKVWEDVLASDKAQMLVERVAGAPEVRAALAQQGFGLLTDLGRQVARLSTKVDAWLERTVRTVTFRPQRDGRTDRAGLLTRGIAAGVDIGLLAAAFSITSSLLSGAIPFLFGSDTLPLWAGILVGFATAFAGGTYFAAFWALEGQTPGMRFLSIRLEDTDGNHRIGPRQANRRLIGAVLSVLTLGIGFLAVLFSDNRRNLSDRMAKTEVVYDEQGTFAPWAVNEIPGAPG
jgi:uncharacterized RDD family membrane protein YckC